MTPKRIQKKGLHWREQYAKARDYVRVYPLMGGRSFIGKVEAVQRNRFGRISYRVNGSLVCTEELTPLGHKGC